MLLLRVCCAAAGSEQQRHLQLPGAASTSKQLAAASTDSSVEPQQDAASEAAERAAVDYLTQHVLTTRPSRHVVDNAMLSRLTATNKTVEEYRNKVSQYLSSSEFKQRWDALKAQVKGSLATGPSRCRPALAGSCSHRRGAGAATSSLLAGFACRNCTLRAAVHHDWY